MTIYESCRISDSSFVKNIRATQEIKNNFYSDTAMHRISIQGGRDFMAGSREGFFQCPFCNGCGSVIWSADGDDDRVLLKGNSYPQGVEPASFEHWCGQYLTVLRAKDKRRII